MVRGNSLSSNWHRGPGSFLNHVFFYRRLICLIGLSDASGEECCFLPLPVFLWNRGDQSAVFTAGYRTIVMSRIRENSLSHVTWCCFFSLNKPAYKEVKFVLLRNQLSQHPWNISLHLIGVSQTDLSPRLVSLCDIKSWFCYSEHAHVVKSCNKRQY